MKTKVLMLSATPVNNKFSDLKNQLAIAYEGDISEINKKLDTDKSIDEIFSQAQRAFTNWSKLNPSVRTTDALLGNLDFDFFELLDSVTIARSRKHIEKYYDTAKIGKFPERNKPISLRPKLTDLDNAINYNEIYDQLSRLTLSIYTPSKYIFPSKLYKYIDETKISDKNLSQAGREEGIRRLMSINLLKRLESSVSSFQLTLGRILALIDSTIATINQFEKLGGAAIDVFDTEEEDWDVDDGNTELVTVGKEAKIELADMDFISWRTELETDAAVLNQLIEMVADITPEHDSKLQELLSLISSKIENPFNGKNKKVLIFSAFSDTAMYLYENVNSFIKKKYNLETAVITGSIDGKTTIKGFRANLNNVLTCFSPMSKGRDVLMPGSDTEIDVFIATDCISEGQNLQDCDYLNPKKLLDDIRLLCRGKKSPLKELCQQFNEETDDGRNMKEISGLLSEAINSIIDCKEESDIDSLFSAGGTSALMSAVSGLDDFELICFLVVK